MINEPCEFCGCDEWDRKLCENCGRVFCTSCEPYRVDDAPIDLCEKCVAHPDIDADHEGNDL